MLALTSLPVELLQAIVQSHSLKHEDLLRLRLVNRAFACLAEPLIFRNADIGYRICDLEVLQRQLAHPRFCSHVRALAIHPQLEVPQPDNWNYELWWYRCIQLMTKASSGQAASREALEAMKAKMRKSYPLDAVAPAWHTLQRMYAYEASDEHTSNVLTKLRQFFQACPRLDALILSDRGFFRSLKYGDQRPSVPADELFSATNPYRDYCEDGPSIRHIVDALRAAISAGTVLRHLTIQAPLYSKPGEEELFSCFQHIFPSLLTLRLTMHVWDQASVFEKLDKLVGLLPSHLTTLKLALYNNEVTTVAQLDDLLPRLGRAVPYLEVFALCIAHLLPQTMIDFVTTHPRLRHVALSDIAPRNRDVHWRPFFIWMRDAQPPLDLFESVHRLGSGKHHHLVIRGTIAHASDNIIDMLCGDVREENYILIENDGRDVVKAALVGHCYGVCSDVPPGLEEIECENVFDEMFYAPSR